MALLNEVGMALISFAQIPGLIAHEPTPATPMSKSFEATCPGLRLRIDRYGGPTRPNGAQPLIFVNGRRLTGSMVDQLHRDLGRARGVYRLAALCSRGERPVMQLRIHYGESDVGGAVSYSAGTAEFVEGRLAHYSPFEPLDAESFWFR
jgi:hypothetical protein